MPSPFVFGATHITPSTHGPQHRLRRRPGEVVDRPLQRGRVVLQMPQHVAVARAAQQAADALPARHRAGAAGVVVVAREPLRPRPAVADVADPALVVEELLVLARLQPVRLGDPLLVSALTGARLAPGLRGRHVRGDRLPAVGANHLLQLRYAGGTPTGASALSHRAPAGRLAGPSPRRP